MEYVQPIRDKAKIEAIKKVLRAQNLRDCVLFTLGINSGLRISDLLQLRVEDVTDGKGRVKDRVSLREQKTGKVKDFPLGASSIKILREYLSEYQEGYLFPSRKSGEPITRQQAWRIISHAAQTVGIKDKIGTHTLRKTFGYWAFKAGVDITRIQKLLNHSSPGITLAYIGITRDELDEVYLNLNL